MSASLHAEIVRGWSAEEQALFPPERFCHLPETESTNDDLLLRARSGEAQPFDLISTDFQTKGRGRRGERWEAPPGRNLLFSLALPLPLTDDRSLWPRLPHLTAEIVGTAIESILGPGPRLQAKWPNDLLYENRKLGGILVEMMASPTPFAIVGVGLNINLRNEELPQELRPIATSLYEIIGCESSRWFLLGLIVQGFLRTYPERIHHFEEVLQWIRARDPLCGRSITLRVGHEQIMGTALGIGEGGELLLDTGAEHPRAIVSAEEIRLR